MPQERSGFPVIQHGPGLSRPLLWGLQTMTAELEPYAGMVFASGQDNCLHSTKLDSH